VGKPSSASPALEMDHHFCFEEDDALQR